MADLEIKLSANAAALLKAIKKAQEGLEGLGDAAKKGAGKGIEDLEKLEEDLAKQGIVTTRALQDQIKTLGDLKQAAQGDAVAVQQLDQKIAGLTKQLKGTDEGARAVSVLTRLQKELGAQGIVTSKQIQTQINTLKVLRSVYKDDAVAATQLDERIERLQATLRNTDRTVANTVKTNNRARIALFDFNRVVQDAPFGFIAIQNNIDQLAQSFVLLKNQTGTARGAFNALLGAFKGPGGILSILSLAGAAMVAFGGTSRGVLSEVKDDAESAREALRSTLDQLLRVQRGGEEVVFRNREDLLGAITETRSKIEDLQSDVDDAAAKLASLGSVQNTSNVAAVELAQKELEIRKRALLEAQDLNALLNTRLEDFDRGVRGTQALIDVGAVYTSTIEEQNDALEEQRKKLEKLEKVIRGALPSIPGGDSVIIDTTLVDESQRVFQERKIARIKEEISGYAKVAKELEKINQKELQSIANADLKALKNEILINQQDILAGKEAQASDVIRKLQQQAAKELVESLSIAQASFLDLGEAGARALVDIATGFKKIEDIGKIVSGIVRKVLSDLVAAAAKAAILTALFPVGAGAAGGFKGLFRGFFGLTPFASGGIVTGPTPALVGEAGPEAIIPLDRLGQFQKTQKLEVTAVRISGGDFILGLQEALLDQGNGGLSLTP